MIELMMFFCLYFICLGRFRGLPFIVVKYRSIGITTHSQLTRLRNKIETALFTQPHHKIPKNLPPIARLKSITAKSCNMRMSIIIENIHKHFNAHHRNTRIHLHKKCTNVPCAANVRWCCLWGRIASSSHHKHHAKSSIKPKSTPRQSLKARQKRFRYSKAKNSKS